MDSITGLMNDLENEARRLDALFPEPSREKSLAKTKLDEARLWVYELSRIERYKS